MSDERGPLYLVTGLLIGIVLGVLHTWIVQPVEYIDTSPASLRPDFKDQYRALIAMAYVANGDLVRANARLELLQDEDVFRALAEQAQRTLAEGADIEAARALGVLAIALGQGAPGPAIVITQSPKTPTPSPTSTLTSAPSPSASPTPVPSLTPTSTPTQTVAVPEALAQTETPTATSTQEPQGTPTDTPIPRPTSTPTRTPTLTLTPGGPFALLSKELICEQRLMAPIFQIEAINAFGQPLGGIPVIVAWANGEETFYTGLVAEESPGFADYTPLPGVVYAIRLGEGGEPATGLSAAECTDSTGNRFWGAWYLKFVQT